MMRSGPEWLPGLRREGRGALGRYVWGWQGYRLLKASPTTKCCTTAFGVVDHSMKIATICDPVGVNTGSAVFDPAPIFIGGRRKALKYLIYQWFRPRRWSYRWIQWSSEIRGDSPGGGRHTGTVNRMRADGYRTAGTNRSMPSAPIDRNHFCQDPAPP